MLLELINDDVYFLFCLFQLQFVDEACHQIERNERNVRQLGVLSYIPRWNEFHMPLVLYTCLNCWNGFSVKYVVKWFNLWDLNSA